MLKRKNKIINRTYKQLCVLYNIWSSGLKKRFHFLKKKNLQIIYRYISYINPVNYKIILKSEVLGVTLCPKTIVAKLAKHASA